jgi:SAM-dependent methyltransferase
MRDWTHIDHYLDKLLGDIYAQPEDSGHTALAKQVIDLWCNRLADCHNVIDVGCGTGFCQPMFEKHGIEYTGVCLGEDHEVAHSLGRNVKKMDFNFLDFEDETFDLIFSRHSLEHSPMPILTLMEWRRVTKNWLGLVIPAPEHYTFEGKNHYSVLKLEQILAILPRAGWEVMWHDTNNFQDENGAVTDVPGEYWIFCGKIKEKI